jgi:hypothetical protein
MFVWMSGLGDNIQRRGHFLVKFQRIGYIIYDSQRFKLSDDMLCMHGLLQMVRFGVEV